MNMKKVLIVIIMIVLAAIALDFIPVKFAIKRDAWVAKENEYLCSSEYKLPYIWDMPHSSDFQPAWGVDKSLNEDDKLTYFSISGNVPESVLRDKDFNVLDLNVYAYGDTSKDTQFIFKGTVKNANIVEEYRFAYLEVDEWEIVYPINRLSFRKKYAPKGYLTIYDFDWIAVMKRIF